ncbi:MAG: hypothetical protein FWG94_00790 [Oscillospiraceae bacterium]|nr:hypothetical protein [Oscillospiraceae bacterium]
MNDIFIEYMVKRKNTPQTALIKAGIVAAAVFIAILCFLFSGILGPLSIIGPLVAFGALYGGYYLITSMNVEFEYAVTNGEIDFDKIIAQRKRVRLATANCRDAEAFGRYKQAEHANKPYQTKIFACDSPDSQDVWYIAVRIKDKGLTLIAFNANDKMLNGVKPFLPRQIMHDAFNRIS